ncbi:MAG: BatD family protein [Cyclobacteriaceae bacterium]|nr:BatD family protein [Cyclobacteriaceae bacterium]
MIARYIFLLFLVTPFQGFSQDTLQIKLDNTMPRLGEKIELSFSIDFFTNALQKQLGENIELTNASSIFGSQNKEFTRVLQLNKLGEYPIGPFSFNFNEKNYTTNSLTIKVIEALPFEEGIWIRLIENNGKKYLIVEQLISNKSDLKKTSNGYSYTVGGIKNEKDNFAEIIESSKNGITINFRGSRTNTIKPEGAGLTDPGLSYSFKKYEVVLDDEYMGDYILSNKDFTNLPKKTKIEKIEIR